MSITINRNHIIRILFLCAIFLVIACVLFLRPSFAAINITTYTNAPYNLPPPNGNSDVTYSATDISRLNGLGALIAKHQQYLNSKVSDPKQVDPFAAVIWSGPIEGINGDPYFYNCLSHSHPINEDCPGFTSGGWEVSYGFQVSQAINHLKDDFNEVYGAGSADNATKVQQVGQAVIDKSSGSSAGKITNPSSFPAVSISTLVSKANAGDSTSQKEAAIIMMDPELGAVLVAREVAGDIGSNWAGTLRGWGQSYYIDGLNPSNPKFSNRMKELAGQYTGVAGSTNTASSGNPDHAVSCVITKVGNPKTSPPPLPPDCTSSTSASGSGNFVYYCQMDPKWQTNGCDIANAGCGPTSLAMIMSTFGVTLTPLDVDAEFRAIGARACGDGSNDYLALTSTWFTSKGFTVGPDLASGGNLDLQQMQTYLSKGYLFLLNTNNYPCKGCVGTHPPFEGVSHYIVVDQVDVAGNRIHTRDPNNCDSQTGKENPDPNLAWTDLNKPVVDGGGQGADFANAWPIKKGN